MSAICVSHLTKSFGRHEAVADLSFSLEPGEFAALIGHNGAGKTTTLKLLTGQLLPSSGVIELGGISVLEQPEEARRIMGYVPETPALYEDLTAREFLELVCAIRGSEELSRGLELAGLGADADRLIREYSQGMRRKTALAAALVARPQVLVLDEALNGLDPPSAARVKGVLKEACQDGATVLLSTHVLETVERIADRAILLAHGRCIANLRTQDIGSEGLEQLFLERIQESRDAPGSP